MDIFGWAQSIRNSAATPINVTIHLNPEFFEVASGLMDVHFVALYPPGSLPLMLPRDQTIPTHLRAVSHYTVPGVGEGDIALMEQHPAVEAPQLRIGFTLDYQELNATA